MKTVEQLTEYLAELDLIGLVKIGAPRDEYESEAKKILSIQKVKRDIIDTDIFWLFSIQFGHIKVPEQSDIRYQQIVDFVNSDES